MKRKTRPKGTRKPAPDLIVIVTEGEKTEPMYFKKFPIHTTKVLKVIGTGTNTKSLILKTDREIQRVKEEYQSEHGIKPRDMVVWCVFDKDSFTDSDFGNAINMARSRGYGVAYSNEAFELWYLLHFQYYDSAITRDRYQDKLSSQLGFTYAKNDERMYQILSQSQSNAIRNARRLMSQYIPINPNDDNPSTTVHELVEFLNQFIVN